MDDVQATCQRIYRWSVIKVYLFIRPENFKLVSKKNKTLRGQVQKVMFFGSYWEMEISIGESIFTVRRDHAGDIKKGDTA
jgi:ABC-type Fe3+/spermidine/putrescine transport system ATPase subunit